MYYTLSINYIFEFEHACFSVSQNSDEIIIIICIIIL